MALSPAPPLQGRHALVTGAADAVRWLCGDAAAAITGQSISVSADEVTT